MKSWAEACSSDDDDSDEDEVEEVVEPPEPEENPQPHGPSQPQNEYILPTEPPYKAFVGNVAFVIKEDEQLANEIKRLCLERFQTDVKIVSSNLAQERKTGQMRGFGYVQVETLEMLQDVLKLNDGKSHIAGRIIHLDVAQPGGTHNNRSSGGNSNSDNHRGGRGGSDIDGSTFRSGRFNNSANPINNPGGRASFSSSNIGNNNARASSFRRDAGDTNGAPPQRTGSFRRDGETMPTNGPPPGQRMSLKLKPRSQGRDDAGSTNSDIFGGGKKQDVGEWEQRRLSETKESRAPVETKEPPLLAAETKEPPLLAAGPRETKEVTKPNDKGGRQTGRGGRGAGGRAPKENSARGGRGGRTGGRGAAAKDGKKADTPKAAAKAAVPVPVAKPTDAEKKPKVVNKFSLLTFDDDSDSD